MTSRLMTRTTPDVRRWMGVSAFLVALFLGIEGVTKLTIGTRPQLDDRSALVAHLQATSSSTLFVILSDTFLMAFLIVFLASFRQLITRTTPDLQWIADLAFGAGLVFVAVTLVGDALDGGSALDVIDLRPDASAIRALIEGHAIMFGATGAVLLALLTATSAYLTFASSALPSWTGYLAAATALSNVAWAVIGFNGTSPNAFFAAGGVGNALLAIFPFLAWVFCVGVVTVRGARRGALKSGEPAGDHPTPTVPTA